MKTASLDLGQLDLLSTSSGLALKLSSRAEFASSEEDGEELEKILTCTILDSNAADKPWVLEGRSLGLVIGLRCQPPLDVAQERAWLDTASETLKTAQLWRQLHLQPTVTQTTWKEGPTPSRVTTWLSRIEDAPENGPRCPHKLGEGVPVHDVLLPSSVSIVRMETVYLDLFITHSHKREGLGMADIKSGHSVNQMEKLQQDMLGSEMLVGAGEMGEDIGEEILEIVDADDLMPEPHSHLPELMQADHPTYEALAELFDAGIKSAISFAPRQLGKNIRAVGSESFRALSDVAPSIWSPGFFTSISSRALLLPTISHALLSVGGSNAQSLSLSAKFAELLRYGENYQRVQKNPQGAYGLIAVELWRKTQAGLLDARRQDHLRLMQHTLADADRSTFEALEEMREENWADFREDAEDEGQDFGLLYDDDEMFLNEHDFAADEDEDKEEILSICGSVESMLLVDHELEGTSSTTATEDGTVTEAQVSVAWEEILDI